VDRFHDVSGSDAHRAVLSEVDGATLTLSIRYLGRASVLKLSRLSLTHSIPLPLRAVIETYTNL
jgi:hypothetical protein